MENEPVQIPISASDEELKGRYANEIQVYQNKEEVWLDFFFIAPPKASLISRVIMSPSHAKRLANVLGANLSNYEKQFGQVEEAPEKKKIGFDTGA